MPRIFTAMPLVLVLAALGCAPQPAQIIIVGSSSSSASADVVAPQISRWRELNSLCRGGSGDNPETLVRCAERDSVGRALDGMGWCFGRKGEPGYQNEWHQCQVNSIR